MNPLFKLFGIDKIFSSFDEKVGTMGLADGCKWLVGNLKIDYQFQGKNFPKNGAALVYSNHPTGLDPYLLTAAIGRNDSYFWGDIYQTKKGNNISKKIISVAPRPFWTIILRPLTNWPGYIYMRLTTPAKSKKETGRINKKALEKTIELLKNSHQVIIFPSGGEYEFLPKKKGLSIVINECKKRNIKVDVYEIKIKKFGELLLFFHFILGFKINAEIVSE
jgi:1-acyl-sn-glycerol-3-phosphate acyltransferase